jgi:hypothetical protein
LEFSIPVSVTAGRCSPLQVSATISSHSRFGSRDRQPVGIRFFSPSDRQSAFVSPVSATVSRHLPLHSGRPSVGSRHSSLQFRRPSVGICLSIFGDHQLEFSIPVSVTVERCPPLQVGRPSVGIRLSILATVSRHSSHYFRRSSVVIRLLSKSRHDLAIGGEMFGFGCRG